MNALRRDAADDAHVISGAASGESLGEQLQVTVIATGADLRMRGGSA